MSKRPLGGTKRKAIRVSGFRAECVRIVEKKLSVCVDAKAEKL